MIRVMIFDNYSSDLFGDILFYNIKPHFGQIDLKNIREFFQISLFFKLENPL